MIKNTASQKVGAQMVSATDGSAFTGSVTVSVTGDAGTQATGSVGSGACTHEGNGYHTYAPAQAETNYDLIAFTFTGTGAVPQTVQIYTRTGDSFARLGAPAGASVSADIAAVKVDTAATLVDTNELQTDWVNGGRLDLLIDAIKAKTDGLPADPADASDIAAAIAALNDLSAAEVNAEVVDALATDTYAEPTGVPGATIALSAKIGWLFMALRNGLTVTSTKMTFMDDGGAAEWEKDLSDDGSTYTESEGNAI